MIKPNDEVYVTQCEHQGLIGTYTNIKRYYKDHGYYYKIKFCKYANNENIFYLWLSADMLISTSDEAYKLLYRD